MANVSYALREDPSTIFLLQDAGRRYDNFCQISVFARNIIKPAFFRQFLSFAPYTGHNGKYQGNATKLQMSIEDNAYTPMRNYVAVIDSEVEFRLTPTVLKQLSKEHMPAWGVKAYLDYFIDRKTGILLFLRVYKIDQELSPSFLEKGVRGASQVLKLYDENEEEVSLPISGLEPVISDNKFDYIKDEILHLLKTENVLIAYYDDTESGLNSLQARVLADRLVQGTHKKWESRHYQWLNDEPDSTDDFDMAQLDYDLIYRDVLKYYPGMKSIIDYVKSIQPPRLGEYDYYLKDVHNHTEKEEAAAKRLFDMSLRFAVKSALYQYEKNNIDLEDAFQEACIGILTAIQKHNDNVSGLFPSYVSMWIRQVLNRDLQPYDYNFHLPVHYNTRTELIVRKLEQSISKNEFKKMSHQELYKQLLATPDCGPSEAYRLAYVLSPAESLEEILKDPLKEEKLPSDIDFETDFIQTLTYSEVREALNILSDREREILYLRYGFEPYEESTLETVGTILGLTRERVRQLESKAERRLHTYLLRNKIITRTEFPTDNDPFVHEAKRKKKRVRKK